jgi:hypothetical protein
MAMIWWPAEQATKALEESGRMTASEAPGQPSKTARTRRVAGSMRLTELPRRLATTRVLPSGERRAAAGSSPAPMAAISRRALRSRTEMVLEPELAT